MLKISFTFHGCCTRVVYSLKNIHTLSQFFVTFKSYKTVLNCSKNVYERFFGPIYLLARICIPFACTRLLSLSLFDAVSRLFTVHTSCFLFSNNIWSLYMFWPSNNQVLPSSKVGNSATTHLFVPLQRLSFSQTLFTLKFLSSV